MRTPEEKRLANSKACRKWRERNREYDKLRQKEYWAANPDKRKAKFQRWRNKDPEHVKELSRQSYARNKHNFTPVTPEYSMYKAAKGRAQRKGLPFDIEVCDVVIPDMCPVFGIPLECGIKQIHDGSPTLDRKVPSLGYVKDNVFVISHKANTIKSHGTAEEHRIIADWIDA